jgi:uncharacterized membrane protein
MPKEKKTSRKTKGVIEHMHSHLKKVRLNPEIHQKVVKHHREKIKSFKAKMDLDRTLTDRFADFLTGFFGSIWFLTLNALWFMGWMLINMGFIPGIPVFDPFPYGLLTMIVSLEAIFLAIIVLISQNRAAHIADLREEVDLQLNVKAEQEITRMIIMLDEIHDHMGLNPEDDEELVMMKQKTDLNEIEKELAKEMGRE